MKIKISEVDASGTYGKPFVITESPETALRSSKLQTELQHRKDAYELVFWTDASLPGPKTRAKFKNASILGKGLCSFSVVHRRWDVQIPKPGEPNWDTTWWLSGFAATGAFHPWQAEALGVIQALRMAVDHCERVSGTIVTPGRPVSSLKRISAAMPTQVSIFCDHPKVIKSLGGILTPDHSSENQGLLRIADELITRLGMLRVNVVLRWVPGHSGDQCNSWAHEGARIAMHLRTCYPAAYSKRLHRVMMKVRRPGQHLHVLQAGLKENDAEEQSADPTS